MRIYAHSLFHFIPIWTNLNKTHLPYSCGIEMIFFNDEKLKKSNLRLLKSSVRIYAYLCASMRVLEYPPKTNSTSDNRKQQSNIDLDLPMLFYKFHDYKWSIIHIVYKIRQRFSISYFWTVFIVKLETLVNFVHMCLPAVHEEYTYTRSDLYVTYWGNCSFFH